MKLSPSMRLPLSMPWSWRSLRRIVLVTLLSLLLTVLLLVRYNGTPSAPQGYYVKRLGQGTPQIGQLVLLCLDGAPRSFGTRRGYVQDTPFSLDCGTAGSSLLKSVQALPGDTVRVSPSDGVFVGARRLSPPPPTRDSEGRPLYPAYGVHVLGPGEFWAGSAYAMGYDSRMFGPVHARQLVAPVQSLWTWPSLPPDHTALP